MTPPRVAFLSDSFHETNGVALTSRMFARFAQESGYPFLCVRQGPSTAHWKEGAAFEVLELDNSPLAFGLEHDLAFDLAFFRHRARLYEVARAFRPDVVHVTGPGHLGMLGALMAHRLGVPLAASWHTNVHEFAARRLDRLLERWPARWRTAATGAAERFTLHWSLRFYRLARLLFAPNVELTAMLEQSTGRSAYLMPRGIDTALYSPARRTRSDTAFVVGYVGRLSPEKNVRMLADIETLLEQAGLSDFRFLIVGDGGEADWLRRNMRHATLPGILRGEPLAEAYAAMDAFVFPSETDTYGNVVLEALASGVPALVTTGGGPKYLVRDGVTGFVVANGAPGFAEVVAGLARDPVRLEAMRRDARAAALEHSWTSVFEGVYRRYAEAFHGAPQCATPPATPPSDPRAWRGEPESP